MSRGKPKDDSKTKPSAATHIIATKTKDSIYSVREPREPQDKMLAKRRRGSQRLSSRSRLKIHDPRESTRHEAIKPRRASRRRLKMLSAGNMNLGRHKSRCWQIDAERRDTYRRDAESSLYFCEHEPTKVTRHDAVKPTPSVVTTLVAKPTQNTKPSQEQPRKKYCTMLEKRLAASRHQSSRRRH
jgi:hypothetical protein